jgi:hypothetical protein
MRLPRFAVVPLIVTTIAATSARTIAQTVTNKSTIEDIRHELLQLPYYSVFDFLAFSYDKGTVTLVGYAYRPALKADAERAVNRVAGVDTVKNQIEELPVSFNDDELRWRAYYAIYRDPFLSRYAPGGGCPVGTPASIRRSRVDAARAVSLPRNGTCRRLPDPYRCQTGTHYPAAIDRWLTWSHRPLRGREAAVQAA